MEYTEFQNLLDQILDGKNIPQKDANQLYSNIVNDDKSVFIVNLDKIVEQYKKWKHYLPNITPFYAVKCNPDNKIIKLLADLGCSFDCASKNEIDKILKLGVSTDRIIFANPCKFISHIEFANHNNVTMMTFDSENELKKIKSHFPNAELLLRIKTDDKNSICPFSSKFGADMQEINKLLDCAKELDLNIIGCSYHVGSGCQDILTYYTAIKDCRKVFDLGKEKGFVMKLLDCGGGFPGIDTKQISFEDIANIINNSINEFFSDWSNLKVIAEPGRFMASSSHVLLLKITNKKVKMIDEKQQNIYYVNESVYSVLNNVIMDHFVVNEDNIIFSKSLECDKTFNSVIYGESCDSIDKIANNIQLPDLLIGNYICITNCGAYTRLFCPCDPNMEIFNGFDQTISIYV